MSLSLKTAAVSAAALALFATSSASAAELIQNGDFEAGGGSLAGWTVGGNVLRLVAADYISCCGTTGSEPAFSGAHFASFGAGDTASVNTLSQTFATVIGATYHLAFLSGALGLPGSQILTVAPIGSYGGGGIADVVTANFDNAYSGSALDFIATQALSTLTFTVKSLGVDGNDEILDDVSVTGPTGGGGVPEPGAWLLMVSGFGLLGARLRRRARFFIA